jgi:hypothetical protein
MVSIALRIEIRHGDKLALYNHFYSQSRYHHELTGKT